MKLHKILIDAVILSLDEIFFQERYADKVIEKVLKSNPKWGARDRAFIAENVYEIVRYWRLLSYITDSTSREQERLEQITAAWFYHKGYEASEWSGFKKLNYERLEMLHEQAGTNRAVIESVPNWLDKLCFDEIGEAWETELYAMNQPAKVVIRTNTLKTDLATLKLELEAENILTDTLEDTPNALVLKERKNLFTTELFKKGHFEVQDAGSQWIAPMLDVKPGMRVIDACAGAGGKTLHLSALMNNKGSLIAMDTEAFKLDELKKRARRAGVGNVETREIDSTKVVKRLHETADRVLLDVPCSGLGVLRRNPDAKWKLSQNFIQKIQVTQRDILSRYSKMIRGNGKMVYATCSILPSESEEQVKWFLAEQAGAFELVEERRCSPSANGYDGFYMACLQKV